jgi:hypothetical protein
MKGYFDKGRSDSDYALGDIVWLKTVQVEAGQHHKMARKWEGLFRIFRVHLENTSVVEIRSVWNQMDECNVNVVLIKRVVVRLGDMILEDIQAPSTENTRTSTPEEGRNKGQELKRSGKERKRLAKRTKDGRAPSRVDERAKVRNREGQMKYTQVVRDRGKGRQQWTKEEEDQEWVILGIVQEIELNDGSIQFRMQFEGFKKLMDARWMDEDLVRREYPKAVTEWEQRKRRMGVEYVQQREGRVTRIKKKRGGNGDK